MKKLFLPPILFIFISFASQAQTSLTIQSLSEKCASVVSTGPNLAIGQHHFQAARDTNFHGTLRSFLQFDLASIPQGSFVNWARLNLFGGVFGNVSPNSFELRRITSPWDPAKVTWNTQPSTSKRGQVHLPSSTEQFENYKNINVTNMVQAMVDSPATSFGFEIKLDTETGTTRRDIIFSSPGDNLLHYCPKIVIEYTALGMKPAFTSMSVNNGLTTVMTIYPNPCNDAFNYNITSAATKMTLKVIDMYGRAVYSQPVNTSNLQMRVNLPSSSAGTYFVVLQDNKGATIVSQQLQVN